MYLDLNRLNATDKDSELTNTWNVDLKKTLNLPTGTEIAIQNSFINQKGISGASIEIEHDITETVQCNIYTTEDIHLNPDQTPHADADQPGIFLESLFCFNYFGCFGPNMPAEYAQNIGATFNTVGGSGVPMILYDVAQDATNAWVMNPVVVNRTFTIKKGIYGINQISEIITKQINGFLGIDRNNEYYNINPVESQVQASVYTGNLMQNAGLTSSLHLGNGVYNYNAVKNGGLDASVAGNYRKIFIPLIEHHYYNENGKVRPNVSYNQYYADNRAFAVYMDNQRAQYPDETPDDYLNVTSYRLGLVGYVIGAPEFQLSYDVGLNGFSLSNLHQAYKPPTHDRMANPIANAGTDCIGIKKIKNTVDLFSPNHDVNNIRAKTYATLTRPMTRIGGASMINFAHQTALDLGDVVVEAGSSANFPDYFSSEQLAKTAWKKTIWSRLGFTYNQLNSIQHFENHKSYANDFARLPGITTDATWDGGALQGISSQVNLNAISPGYGAGSGAVIKNIQLFNQTDIATPHIQRPLHYPHTKLSNAIDMYAGSIISGDCTMINLTTTSHTITARNLPTLSVYGYYLITGDIISGHNDIVKNGDPLPLMGVVPKSSLSNQDFFAVNNEIVHVLSSEKNLNSIKITILNPDLTNPELESNSSVILRISTP